MHDTHKFLLHPIPIVAIQSKRSLSVRWLDILLASNRLDYLIRFLTNIKQTRGGFIGYCRILERLAEKPQGLDTILRDSPKREIKKLAELYISKKTRKWHEILIYLESKEWGYPRKNYYENNSYAILLSVGLNQISIDDYFKKHRHGQT
ncbi:MAG: hypothetical protein ACFFFG_18475 [Candidatus Thorarchaeota archaeon]